MAEIKFKSVFLIFIILLIHATVYSESTDRLFRLTDELTIEKAADDVYIVTHSFPWPANSMLVKCSEQVFVWVDTPYNNEATRQTLDWVVSRFGKVEIIEINTGFHNDNLGGNGYLIENDFDVFGSDLTVQLLRERAEQTRLQLLKWLEGPKMKKYHDAHASTTYTEPNQIFDIKTGLKLTLGREKIEVYYPGPSHSPDNVVVYFPDKKLLFGGCMVKSTDSRDLGFTGDADLQQWPVSLKKVLTKYSDTKMVIPGHGTRGGLELIHHTLSLF